MSIAHSFRVLTLCGSLRNASSNRGLLAIAQRVAPPALLLEPFAMERLPYYNLDLDQPGSEPDVVLEWRNRVTAADAVLIATPEYNGSLPAVLKNAIDWATRPPGQHVFAGKVVTVMSSGGGGGGAKALGYLNGVLPFFGNTAVTEPAIELKKGAEFLQADGGCSDPSVEPSVRDRLANLLAALEAR